MCVYERLFAPCSRRGLIVSLAGLLGGGGLLGSKLFRLLEKGEKAKGIVVEISFFSTSFPGKKYRNIDEFWKDHPSLVEASIRSLDVLKNVAGQRLSTRILATGQPACDVYYPNFEAYINHSDYLKQVHGVERVQISENCFKYISQDFFAVDEIKKVS